MQSARRVWRIAIDRGGGHAYRSPCRKMLALAMAMLVAGCRTSDVRRESTGKRKVRSGTAPTVLWSASGSTARGTWYYANRIAADSLQVYVLDSDMRTLTALRARDGAVAWTRGNTGDTVLFRFPLALTVDSNGEAIVADRDQHALLIFNPRGVVVRRIPMPPPIYAMCSVSQELLLLTTALTKPLWLVNGDGELLSSSNAPWPGLGTTPPEMAGSFASSDAHDACVYALERGSGFAIWANGSWGVSHAYVEQPDRASTDRPPVVRAVASALVDSSVVVAFQGHGKKQGAFLDIYDGRTGVYRESLPAPEMIFALAHVGRTFFAVVPGAQARKVIAFRYPDW